MTQACRHPPGRDVGVNRPRIEHEVDAGDVSAVPRSNLEVVEVNRHKEGVAGQVQPVAGSGRVQVECRLEVRDVLGSSGT